MPESHPSSPPARSLRLVSAEAEHRLLGRLIARDEGALVELIELATPWLLGITQAMLSDRDEAEEVVLETFSTVWNRTDLLDAEGPGLIPWLLRICRNRAIDRLRRRRRHATKVSRLGAHADFERHARPVEVDEAGRPGWHVHEQVHTALGNLPADQRAVVQLAYFEGLTHSEIAERLGIPLGTVKTRLRLAFEKLRSSLGAIKDWVV